MKNPTLTRGLTAVAPVLIATLLLGSCSRSGNAPAKTGGASLPVPVLASPAVAKTMPVQIRAIGNVTPISKVTVRAQVTGRLQAVNFKEGQPVRRGDLLFTLDPRPAQAALAQATASLARDTAQLGNARIQFNREQKLFTEKVVSQDEFDTSKATLDALAGTVAADQAATNTAALNLEYTAIRSPVEGVAGSQQVYEGNIVKSPDDVMLTINQIHPIYVVFAVPEQYLADIRKGMGEKNLKVEAGFAGMTGAATQGELTFVDNTVDTTTGTIQLKGTFPNDDKTLWPGQFVQVTLTLSEILNAIVVPSQAIQTGQNGQFIFVVKPDQTVEMRPVTTSDSVDGTTVVASGLKAGEVVVTDGQLRLVPGAKVSLGSLTAGDTSTNAAPDRP